MASSQTRWVCILSHQVFIKSPDPRNKRFRACLDALGMLLEVYKRNETIVLTESKAEGPSIVGRVYIHPSARVDPTAKVCLSRCLVVPLSRCPIKQTKDLTVSDVNPKSLDQTF